MGKLNVLQAALAAAVWMSAAGQVHAQVQYYDLTLLDSPAGVDVAAQAINDSGVIAGATNVALPYFLSSYPSYYSYSYPAPNAVADGLLWDGHVATNLSRSFSVPVWANAINDSGMIVGAKRVGANYYETQGVRWLGSRTTLASLAAPQDALGSEALAVSDAGVVAGVGYFLGGPWQNPRIVMQATKWDQYGSPQVLATSEGGQSRANGVSADGSMIVGTSIGSSGGSWDATVWHDDGQIEVLGAGYALAINDRGWVVGGGDAYSGVDAKLWRRDGSYVELGTLGGDRSEARAINDAGLVVGWATAPGHYEYVGDYYYPYEYFVEGPQYAVAWSADGTVINLNSRLTPEAQASGWDLLAATGVNNDGLIVGYAKNSGTGQLRAFSLAPSMVPEADGCVMAVLGAGWVWVSRRRRGTRG